MSGFLRMKAGESTGKLVFPDLDNVAETTPKGDLESILETAKFAAENAIKNRYLLAPWLPECVITKYDISFETHDFFIISRVRVESTEKPGLIATLGNIVSLTTLLDMFKSVTKNVYIADIITSGENYTVKEIEIKHLPIEGVYIEGKTGDIFPVFIGTEIPGAITLSSVIIKEYDTLVIGAMWLEMFLDDINIMAKVITGGAATITDKAYLIRRIRK